jgi:putative transposase
MVTQQATTRQEREQTIANLQGQVNQIDELLYTVKSQSGNGEYTINKINGQWSCTCPDNTFRHVPCKHIFAVDFSHQLKVQVATSNNRANRIIQEIITQTNCQYCHSIHIKKMGIRHNKSGDIQRF